MNPLPKLFRESSHCAHGAPTGVPTTDPFFIGEDGRMLDIPNGFGGTTSFLADFHNRGQLTGTLTLPGDTTDQPFLWSNGVLTDLGTFWG